MSEKFFPAFAKLSRCPCCFHGFYYFYSKLLLITIEERTRTIVNEHKDNKSSRRVLLTNTFKIRVYIKAMMVKLKQNSTYDVMY